MVETKEVKEKKKFWGNITFADAKKWGLQEVNELKLKPGVEFILSECVLKLGAEKVYSECCYFKILKREKTFFVIRCTFMTGSKDTGYIDINASCKLNSRLTYYFDKSMSGSTSFRIEAILVPTN